MELEKLPMSIDPAAHAFVRDGMTGDVACRQNGRRPTKTPSDSAPNLSLYEQGLAKTTPINRERTKTLVCFFDLYRQF